MFLKFIFLSLSLSYVAHASAPEIAVRKFVSDKYFKGADKTLSVNEDKNMPFLSAHLYRVRPMKGESGWTVLVDETGTARETDKTSLKSFLQSLEKGFEKVKLSSDPKESVKISNGLINHLTSGRRDVNCKDEKGQINCELSILEGQFAGQKASLGFDAKAGAIKVK